MLLADTKPLDQLGVAIGIFALEVVEKTAALPDQFEESAPGVMILGV